MKIYIAAPLFNEMEIERNNSINDLLEVEGFETYLPQRDEVYFMTYGRKDFRIRKLENKFLHQTIIQF